MPDESCRRCGGELVKHLWCNHCRKTIQKICKMCTKETLMQQHTMCISYRTNENYVTKVALTV